MGYRSLKVTENCTIRKLGHGFLFVFHSNYGSILYYFQYKAKYCPKIAVFYTRCICIRNDDVVFVDVSAARCQSASRHSRSETSSCDVMTPPSAISDVDVDVVNTAAVVCPGWLFTLCTPRNYTATSTCFCRATLCIARPT